MALKYELAKLESVISRDISDFIRMNYELDQKLFQRFAARIHQETENVKDNFSRATLYFKNKRTLACYIRFHQRALIELSGNLTKYVQPHEINVVSASSQAKAKLIQELYFSLQELLTFVRRHFAQYFDMDAWIPESYRLIVLNSIETDVKELQTSLSDFKVSPRIIDFALSPFREFFSLNTSDGITYRRVVYLKELQRELNDLIAAGANPDPSIAVQWRLLYLNYNFTGYFQYCTNQITQYYTETEDISEQIQRLALVQKLVSQSTVKPDFSYDPSMKSLKEQLTDWIAQETYYLETRMQYLSESSEHEAPEKTANYKVKIDLSVAQVAYLIRVFVEIKILQIQNISQLLRHVSKFFNTKGAESISYTSLQGKYYKPESSTKKAVRDLLKKMVNYIESTEYLT